MTYVEDIYELSREFPEEERYGLTSQIRRAAVSIPSNIAEGAARDSSKEFIRFLYIVLGSLSEVKIQLELVKALNFISDNKQYLDKNAHIRRMLLKLIKSIKRKTE